MEQLNAEYDGLNLSYSEEGDYLNLNTEQMNEYIDAKMALDESNALITRQNELYQEEATPSNRICRSWMKKAELDAQLADKALKQSEYNELMEQLNRYPRGLYPSGRRYCARKSGRWRHRSPRPIRLPLRASSTMPKPWLLPRRKEMERRSNAPSPTQMRLPICSTRIETKSKVSVSQMIANLRHNQEALQQWSGKSGHACGARA